jgi:ketosteroid isomerase-like protein
MTNTNAPSATDATPTLDQLNQAFIEAYRSANVTWHETWLDQDFVNTQANGSLETRSDYIAQTGKGGAPQDFECHDVHIRVLGNEAIIHALVRYTRPDGTPGQGRYTDVWALRSGGWRCVAAHATRM